MTTTKVPTAMETQITNVDNMFNDMLDKYKSNYVNYHTNSMLSQSDSKTTTTSASLTATKDPNEAELMQYRYAANKLLEQVRSQISTNSASISKINAEVLPIQQLYIKAKEHGNAYLASINASAASLSDYNELYKTVIFSSVMYLIGSASILYIIFKAKSQDLIPPEFN